MFAFVCRKVEEMSRRRLIFFYDMVWMAILAAIAWYLMHANNCVITKPLDPLNPFHGFSAENACALWVRYRMLLNCMWFGALGGVTISLKGVYDHGASNDPWKNDFNLWHIGRPVSCAIAGFIAGLLFYLVIPTATLSPLVLYGIAFVFGTQDRAFFDFLSQFLAKFLPPKPETGGGAGPRISAVFPSHGPTGTIVTIQGQGLQPTWGIKLGTHSLDNVSITPDGTTAVGVVPAIAGIDPGKSQLFDIIVADKTGSGAALTGKFTYEQKP